MHEYAIAFPSLNGLINDEFESIRVIMVHFVRNIAVSFVLFLLFQTISFAQSTDQQKYASLELQQEATIQDTLRQFSTRANSLWSQQESDLNFATDFLSIISRTAAETYYKQASIYYFWSLKNARFDTGQKAIEQEVNRLLPLVSDSTQKKWRQYLDQKDPKLFNSIYGFWTVRDPYSSTPVNERLIEHWKRIEYAQANFNENDNSVYGTDERGVYYVRMGSPDKLVRKNIYLNGVIDPVGFQYISFELGNVVQTDVEIWEYKTEDDSYLYMFGKKDGIGEFGLRKNVMELVDSQGLRVEVAGGNFMSPSKLRRLSERVAQVGLYNILAPYHPFFDQMYKRLETSLYNSSLNSSIISRYLQSSFTAEALMLQNYYTQIEQAPRSDTDLKYSNEYLATRTQVFRSLNSNNKNEYLFSIQPVPGENIQSYDSHFLSNKLFIYDDEWKLLSEIDDLKKVDEESIKLSATYQIDESALENDIYFSSELIDTSRNSMTLPGKINSKTTAIVASTGKEKLSFPEPLNPDQPLLISDIIMGPQQEGNFEARVPIIPSLDYKFEEGSDIMVYFETYNIPEGGYKFTYFFKKDRWLLSHKKIERTQVTIVGDKVQKRDNQLFSINLKDLKPDSYQFILQFSPIDNSTGLEPVQRIVDIEIVE